MITGIVGILLIPCMIGGLYIIAWYTSRIRALEKGKPYAGFLIEVLLKSGINNDFAPILINPPAWVDASNYPGYERRNRFVKIYWIFLCLFLAAAIILSRMKA